MASRCSNFASQLNVIGSAGADTLTGNASDNLLLGNGDDVLRAGDNDVLIGGAGLSSATHPVRLTAATVFNDLAIDQLFGRGGLDWFFFSELDVIGDQNTGGSERVTAI